MQCAEKSARLCKTPCCSNTWNFILFLVLYLAPGFSCKEHAIDQWCIVGKQISHFCIQTKTYIVYVQWRSQDQK